MMTEMFLRFRQCQCAILLAVTGLALGYPAAVSQLVAQQPVPPPSGGTPQPGVAAVAPPVALAFKGVTVVNVTDGKLLPAQTVVVVGNRIQAAGPAHQVSVPTGAQVVDAQGKYLIPGLWDMHVHVDNRPKATYPLFIAHGVTGIREMAQRFPNGPDSLRVWQREVAAGTRVGPRSIGPSVDLTANGAGGEFTISTPEDVRRIIDSLKAAGIAFLKIHAVGAGNKPDLYFAMLREARRVGLPVAGHTPDAVTEVEVADSGQRSVEHVNEHNQCWPALRKPDSAAVAQRCRLAAEAYIRNGTWLVPTLFIFRDHSQNNAMFASLFKSGLSFVRTMHGFGLRTFLAGTDATHDWPFPMTPHGFALPLELTFLVEAGLTPLEALQAATLNPAKYLNATDSLGTIAEGKLADLVLLDANPLDNISNVMTIQAVVANGRFFDRAALDTMDPQRIRRAKAFAVQQPSAAGTKGTGP